MYDSFKNRMNVKAPLSVGQSYKRQSDILMDTTFTHDRNYQRCMLYDRNMQPLEEVDVKYQKTTDYTISKDQIEYLIQFRPDFQPEVAYPSDDGVERLGFYLDIKDNLGNVNKWLVVGKDDRISFLKYNVLKCNQVFKWIIDGTIYNVLGVLRSRNKLNCSPIK